MSNRRSLPKSIGSKFVHFLNFLENNDLFLSPPCTVTSWKDFVDIYAISLNAP